MKTNQIFQKTILNSVSFSGRGAINNTFIKVTLKPAEANSGIIFIRTDLEVNNIINLSFNKIDNVKFNTTVTNGYNSVSIVEHLLASLWNFGIYNLIVEVDGPEFPLIDGSCEYFIFLIKAAGVKIFKNERQRYIKLKKTIQLQKENDPEIEIIAAESDDNNLLLSYYLDFQEIKSLEKNFFSFNANLMSFESEISYARTFSVEKDLKNNNKTQNPFLNEYNAIIYKKDSFFTNEKGLRYENEPTRHKILDLIGDLMLLGYPLIGKIIGKRSGHQLNQRLVKEILSDKSNYTLI